MRDGFRLKLYLIQNEVLHLSHHHRLLFNVHLCPRKSFQLLQFGTLDCNWKLRKNLNFYFLFFNFVPWRFNDYFGTRLYVLYAKTYNTAVPPISTTALPPWWTLNSVTFFGVFFASIWSSNGFFLYFQAYIGYIEKKVSLHCVMAFKGSTFTPNSTYMLCP